MQNIVHRVTHTELSPREVSGEEINFPLRLSFICYRIPVQPSMTKQACRERQKQCYERDNSHIRNPLSECRGCPGPSHAEDYIKSLPHEGPGEINCATEGGGMVLGKCPICNHDAWTTGGYCMSCHGQVKIAAGHGVAKDAALKILKKYYDNGGKRPLCGGKDNIAKRLINWEVEEMSKVGVCEWCGRTISLVKAVQGKKACMFCMKGVKSFTDNGGKEEDFEELHGVELREKAWECEPGVKTQFSWIGKKGKLSIGLDVIESASLSAKMMSSNELIPEFLDGYPELFAKIKDAARLNFRTFTGQILADLHEKYGRG